MAKKYVCIQDCEYKGRLYRAGESALFPDGVEIADLFWESEAEYNKKIEEERIVDDSISSLSEEEKDEKIKELTKQLKKAKKEPAKAEPVKATDIKDEK